MVAEVTLISGLDFALVSLAALLPVGADNCRMNPVTLFLMEGMVTNASQFELATALASLTG